MTINYEPGDLTANFTWRKFSGSTDPATPQRILLQDRNRIAVVFFLSTDTYYAGPFSDITVDSNGWTVDATTGPLQLLYKDWGAMIGSEWYVIDSGLGPFTVNGFEVIYQPRKRGA